jgi:cytochrome P450
MCIGKRFAEEEGILLLALLLAKFQVELVAVAGKPAKAEDLVLGDIPTIANVTMTFRDKFTLHFKEV